VVINQVYSNENAGEVQYKVPPSVPVVEDDSKLEAVKVSAEIVNVELSIEGKLEEMIKRMIGEKKIGNVIFYDRNLSSSSQAAALSNELQTLAMENKEKIPLMIGVDQEGGDVMRMKEQVSPLPSQQEIGKYGSEEDAYLLSKITGRELSSMGITVDFAPVLDLSDHDTRSYGKDPTLVKNLGKAAAVGLNEAGADLLLVCHSPESQLKVYNGIIEVIKS
jgi:beta-glucosidase-like glycosyl hydrolase